MGGRMGNESSNFHDRNKTPAAQPPKPPGDIKSVCQNIRARSDNAAPGVVWTDIGAAHVLRTQWKEETNDPVPEDILELALRAGYLEPVDGSRVTWVEWMPDAIHLEFPLNFKTTALRPVGIRFPITSMRAEYRVPISRTIHVPASGGSCIPDTGHRDYFPPTPAYDKVVFDRWDRNIVVESEQVYENVEAAVSGGGAFSQQRHPGFIQPTDSEAPTVYSVP